MSQHRKHWSSKEKLIAVQTLKSKGSALASRECNVSATTLYKWVKLFDQLGEDGLSGRKKILRDQELSRLEKEIHELKMIVAEKELALRISNELLKKSQSQKKTE